MRHMIHTLAGWTFFGALVFFAVQSRVALTVYRKNRTGNENFYRMLFAKKEDLKDNEIQPRKLLWIGIAVLLGSVTVMGMLS